MMFEAEDGLAETDSLRGGLLMAPLLGLVAAGLPEAVRAAKLDPGQTQITMPDESVLQVTEQRFVSPSGAQLDGVGVTPDVTVEMSDEDLQNDRDPQLTRALELVVQKLNGG